MTDYNCSFILVKFLTFVNQSIWLTILLKLHLCSLLFYFFDIKDLSFIWISVISEVRNLGSKNFQETHHEEY